MKTNSRVLLLTLALIGVGVLISMIVFLPSSPVQSEDTAMTLPTEAIESPSNLIQELDAYQPVEVKTATFAVG